MTPEGLTTMVRVLRTNVKDLLVAGELLKEWTYPRSDPPEDYQAVWEEAAAEARDTLATLEEAIRRAKEKAL